jgi:hypothetical protein
VDRTDTGLYPTACFDVGDIGASGLATREKFRTVQDQSNIPSIKSSYDPSVLQEQ